jgi:hypothetical protein
MNKTIYYYENNSKGAGRRATHISLFHSYFKLYFQVQWRYWPAEHLGFSVAKKIRWSQVEDASQH